MGEVVVSRMLDSKKLLFVSGGVMVFICGVLPEKMGAGSLFRRFPGRLVMLRLLTADAVAYDLSARRLWDLTEFAEPQS